MSDNYSQMAEVLKSYQEKCPPHHKLYLASQLSDKQLHNILEGLTPPVLYDDILGFLSSSFLSNGRTEVLFMEHGCYISRKSDVPYYIEYADIHACKISNGFLTVTLITLKTIEFSRITSAFAEFLQDILFSLAKFFPNENWYVVRQSKLISRKVKIKVTRSGSVQDGAFPCRRAQLIANHLLSGDIYSKCCKIIASSVQTTEKVLSAKVLSALTVSTTAEPTADLVHTILRKTTSQKISVQALMFVELGKVLGITLDRAAAKSILKIYADFLSRSGMTAIFKENIGLINASTSVPLTKAVGWLFVYNYAIHIKKYLRNNLLLFQHYPNRLSPAECNRFISDIVSIPNYKVSINNVNQFFWSTLASYSLALQIDITSISSRYADLLKQLLDSSKQIIDMNSQAGRYYTKFQSMDFSRENVSFEQLADFVELFLGFYNLIQQNDKSAPIQQFSFDIDFEKPDIFFRNLYDTKEKRVGNTVLKFQTPYVLGMHLQERYMVHVITSLLYHYAADRERNETQ